MSISALNWAFAQKTETPSEKLVLIALADHADVRGQCWPRHRLVAEKTGLSESNIRATIAKLVSRGLIRKSEQFRDDGGQSSNIYWLAFAEEQPSACDKRPPANAKRPPASGWPPLTIIEPPSDHQRTEPPIPPKAQKPVATLPGGFVAFWTAYPKKVGKAAALRAWKKMRPPAQAVLDALAWQVNTPQWTRDGGQYVPHPATWINQGRWEDEAETTETDAEAWERLENGQ